jgi:uncharacterized repeat protein (TIGR03803 family)
MTHLNLYSASRIFKNALASLFGVLLLAVVVRAAAPFDVVYGFSQPPQNPGQGTLVLAADGSCWGTTLYGGAYGWGTIFRVNADGSDWQTIVSFSGTSGPTRGKTPTSGLLKASDGNFYGTTFDDGANGYGTLFRITPAGNFTTLADFTGQGAGGNGDSPTGALIQLGNGDIYGTTTFGGSHGAGSVFRYSGGLLQTVAEFDFNGTNNRGGYPMAGLVVAADGKLYGTTSQGGNFGAGTVFQLPVGGALQAIVDFTFSGAVNRGAMPMTSLTLGDDQLLYGVTRDGGMGGFGTVFKVTTAGVLTTLMEFSTSDPRGLSPLASLLKLADGTFLGATTTGGASNAGTLFHVTPAGVLTTVIDFTDNGATNRGSAPATGMVPGSDGNYYGATQYGGSLERGTVYRLTPQGVLTTLTDFESLSPDARGSNPWGGLVAGPDGFLYGMTTGGGANELGTVFKIAPDGTLTTLVEFTGAGGSNRGANPFGGLTAGPAGAFFGTTSGGGANGDGTIFRITPDGTLTTLVDFQFNGATNRGASPYGNLTLASDGNFYGVTQIGGANGLGTIFRMTPAGVLTSLVQFSGTTGAARGSTPYAGLIAGPGGLLYGTTSQGGASDFGTIYAMSLSGVLTPLFEFTNSTTTARGAFPYGSLVVGNDGLLYGTTIVGGANDVGTIFRLTTGGALTTLLDFTDDGATNRGSNPYAGLVKDASGNLFGTTRFGGANQSGTLFGFVPGGSLTTLVEFTGAGSQANGGDFPAYGTPIIGPSGNLYGTTVFGGPNGAGEVYRFILNATLPRVVAIASTAQGPKLTASGIPGVTYFVQLTDDLTSAWTIVSPPIVADALGAFSFVDTSTPLPSQRFYRVISGP